VLRNASAAISEKIQIAIAGHSTLKACPSAVMSRWGLRRDAKFEDCRVESDS